MVVKPVVAAARGEGGEVGGGRGSHRPLHRMRHRRCPRRLLLLHLPPRTHPRGDLHDRPVQHPLWVSEINLICATCQRPIWGSITDEEKEATRKKQFRNSGKSFCGRASLAASLASTSLRSPSRGCATDWRSRAPVISSPIWSTHCSLPLSTRCCALLLGC